MGRECEEWESEERVKRECEDKQSVGSEKRE